MWTYIFTCLVLWLATTGVYKMFPHFSNILRVGIYILVSALLYVFGNPIMILITIIHNIVFLIIFGKRALINKMDRIKEKNRQKYNNRNQ